MRYMLRGILLILLLPAAGWAQYHQTVLSLDSQVGYSSNSYLNPFIGEWDPALNSSYAALSLMGESMWSSGPHAFSVGGGMLVEPFFQASGSWKGGMGVARYHYRLSNRLQAGVESGGSYFNADYDRSRFWFQPGLSWTPTPFTALRLKAGSSFQSYNNYADTTRTAGRRYDLYALEAETWPGYHWQLSAGLYGTLESLPDIQRGFSASLAARYLFKSGAAIQLRTGLEQYQWSTTVTNTTQGGGPPMMGPGRPAPQPSEQQLVATDRIMRMGIRASYPVNERFTLYGSLEGLGYNPAGTSASTFDTHISGGVRYSFVPRFRRTVTRISPDWDVTGRKQVLHLRYRKDGRLFLVGDFNDWKRPGIPLREQGSHDYVAQLKLEPGAYEYTILHLDGTEEKTLQFSNDTYTVDDGYGGKNALLLVE